MNHMLRASALCLALFAFTLPASAHSFKLGNLTIHHPWSRATPGGAKVGVGYMVIDNAGKEADRLIGIESPIADKAEVHEMTMEGDVMKMRQVEGGLEIPAGGSAILKPAGYHVMFVGLKQPIVEGKPFEATLTFEKAGTVTVSFKVEAIGAMQSSDSPSGESHMDHGDMDHGSMDHMDHMNMDHQ